MTNRDERDARAHFSQRYAAPSTATLDDIERRVLGGAWGANGYTTVAQADTIGRALRLDGAKRLLDVGTGRGYPGLYLAAKTGCSVVGTDMPIEACPRRLRRRRHQPRPSRGTGLLRSSAESRRTGAHRISG